MSPDELKNHARRIAEELLTQGALAVADELFAPNCHHFTPYPVPLGPEGMKMWVSTLRRAFPDLYAIVEEEIAEGRHVAQRLTLGGTHEAALFGFPPSGRRTTWSLVQLLRVNSSGQFSDHWCVWDELGLRRRLDAMSIISGDLHER